MNEFLAVLAAVVPVVCMAGAGVVMRSLQWLTAAADASLLRVTINVLVPCLILDSILGNQALEKPGNLLMPPLVGFGTVTLGLAVAWGTLWVSGLTESAARRTFVVATAVYNYGYVPLPLVLLLFDRETAGVLFIHNVGAEMAVWTLGLSILRGGRLRAAQWRHLVNPPLVAITLALLLNWSGWEALVSGPLLKVGGVVMTAVSMMGQCAVPLGLILIGATMTDHRHEFHPARGGRVMVWASVLRLGVLPAGFLLIGYCLPLSVELKRIVVLQAAMPSAVFPIILTRHYGGDTQTALRIVVITSLLGLVTIPLWIRIGMQALGI